MQHPFDMIIKGANLPGPLFTQKFSRYFFFDNDICTSDWLITATQQIIRACFGETGCAHVFASTSYTYLGVIGSREDWLVNIAGLCKQMHDSREYGGFIIVDAQKQWALFQNTPVENGVLGINSDKDLSALNDTIYDIFVDCEIIKGWLNGSGQRERSLVESIGFDYLTALLKYYDK